MPATEIAITDPGVTVLASNAKITIAVTVKPTNATVKTVTRSSVNKDIAAVNSGTGAVTALKVTAATEEATISAAATDDSRETDSVTFTVCPFVKNVEIYTAWALRWGSQCTLPSWIR